MMSELDAFSTPPTAGNLTPAPAPAPTAGIPTPAAPPAPPNPTTPEKSNESNDEEMDRVKAAATIDSIRRGVLALREAKVEAEDKTKGMVDKMKEMNKQKCEKAKAAQMKARNPNLGTRIAKSEPLTPVQKAEKLECCLDKCLKAALGCTVGKSGPDQSKAINEAKTKVAELIDKASKEKQAAAAAKGNKPGDAKDKGKAIGDQMK